MEQTKKTTAKKVINVIVTVLVILYTIFALTVSVMIFASMGSDTAGHPSLFGHTFMYVRTDSMEGDADDAIFKGDLVVCEKLDDYTDLEVGQIIAYDFMYRPKNEDGSYSFDTESQENITQIIRVHRIIEKNADGTYTTMGDNSPGADPEPVSPSSIVGVYNGTRIPAIGGFFEAFHEHKQTVILCCLVLPMALFFLYALYKFIKALLEYRMSKAPAAGLSEEQKQAAIEEYLAKQAQQEKENAPPAEDKVENNSADDNSAE